MKIVCSNLAMRFYVADGWTKAILSPLLEKGEVSISHPEDSSPYFTLEVASRFDLNRLMEHCSEVVRTFNDIPTLSDREFLERFNGY